MAEIVNKKLSYKNNKYKRQFKSKVITQAIFEAILDRTTEGKPLRTIAKELNFNTSVFYKFLGSAPEECRQAYNEAKKEQADTLADEILTIAKQVMDGKVIAHQGRVAIDAYKWIAAKLKPKKYGERIENVHQHTIDITPMLEAGRQRVLDARKENPLQHKGTVVDI